MQTKIYVSSFLGVVCFLKPLAKITVRGKLRQICHKISYLYHSAKHHQGYNNKKKGLCSDFSAFFSLTIDNIALWARNVSHERSCKFWGGQIQMSSVQIDEIDLSFSNFMNSTIYVCHTIISEIFISLELSRNHFLMSCAACAYYQITMSRLELSYIERKVHDVHVYTRMVFDFTSLPLSIF